MKDGMQSLVSGAFISRLIHLCSTSHAKYFGLKYTHSGVVFQGRYKNKIITDVAYLKQVVTYILENPVRKGYVKSWEDWKYSGSDPQLINEIISE